MAGWSGPVGRPGRRGPAAAAAGVGCACVVRTMVTPWSRLTSQQSTLIADLQLMHVCNLYRFATNAGSCAMGPMSELGLRELGPLIDQTLGSVLASPPCGPRRHTDAISQEP